MKIIKPFLLLLLISFLSSSGFSQEIKKKIVYLNNDNKIPFWQILGKGIKNELKSTKYEFEIYDAKNSAKKELELTIKAIKERVAGIIISPSNSSACVTVLKLLKKANIPVVIADVGSDSHEYISYISSDNKNGGYIVGKELAKYMIKKDWQDGEVGILAIPQKRLNGQKRTQGFIKALKESNIKSANIKQLVTWNDKETYLFTKNFIKNYPNLRAIWLQTSNPYKGALKAIKEMDKEKEIAFVTFDAEPEFFDLITKGEILASGMQQPYMMGKDAAKTIVSYLNGKKVEKIIQIPVLLVSTKNIKEMLPKVKLNVLGIEQK